MFENKRYLDVLKSVSFGESIANVEAAYSEPTRKYLELKDELQQLKSAKEYSRTKVEEKSTEINEWLSENNRTIFNLDDFRSLIEKNGIEQAVYETFPNPKQFEYFLLSTINIAGDPSESNKEQIQESFRVLETLAYNGMQFAVSPMLDAFNSINEFNGGAGVEVQHPELISERKKCDENYFTAMRKRSSAVDNGMPYASSNIGLAKVYLDNIQNKISDDTLDITKGLEDTDIKAILSDTKIAASYGDPTAFAVASNFCINILGAAPSLFQDISAGEQGQINRILKGLEVAFELSDDKETKAAILGTLEYVAKNQDHVVAAEVKDKVPQLLERLKSENPDVEPIKIENPTDVEVPDGSSPEEAMHKAIIKKLATSISRGGEEVFVDAKNALKTELSAAKIAKLAELTEAKEFLEAKVKLIGTGGNSDTENSCLTGINKALKSLSQASSAEAVDSIRVSTIMGEDLHSEFEALKECKSEFIQTLNNQIIQPLVEEKNDLREMLITLPEGRDKELVSTAMKKINDVISDMEDIRQKVQRAPSTNILGQELQSFTEKKYPLAYEAVKPISLPHPNSLKNFVNKIWRKAFDTNLFKSDAEKSLNKVLEEKSHLVTFDSDMHNKARSALLSITGSSDGGQAQVPEPSKPETDPGNKSGPAPGRRGG